MSNEIIINSEIIDKSIKDLNKQIELIEKEKAKIKKLPFFCEDYSGRKSRGPCALQMQEITYNSLYSTAESLKDLIKSTIEFLNAAKEKTNEIDKSIANNF